MTGNEIYSRYGFKRDEPITTTVKFTNGFFMDIKLVICGDDEPPYTETVLFGLKGNQLVYSEPDDTYVGKWQLDYNDNSYIVYIDVDYKEGKDYDNIAYCANNRTPTKHTAHNSI